MICLNSHNINKKVLLIYLQFTNGKAEQKFELSTITEMGSNGMAF